MMGSGSSLPPAPEARAIFELLSLVVDPEGTKGRLEALAAAQAKHDGTLAEARAVQADAKEKLQQALDANAKLSVERAAHDKIVVDTRADFERQAKDMKKREEAVSDREADAARKENDVYAQTQKAMQKAAELAVKEKSILAREATLADAVAKHQSERQELESQKQRIADAIRKK